MTELRQGRMSSEERIDSLRNYEKPDRVPLNCGGINMPNCGYKAVEAFTDPEKSLRASLWTSEQYRWDVWSFYPDHTVRGDWDFGARMSLPESEYSMGVSAESYAVTNAQDVWQLEVPDPETAGAVPIRVEYARCAAEAGLPIGFGSRSPFSTAVDMCGIQRFARWLVREPELCERLIKLAVDHIFNVLDYFIDTFGRERIRVSMSSPNESNNIFSPDLIAVYAMPYHREYHRRLRTRGFKDFYFHICGEQNLNLPTITEFAASEESWPHPSILSFGDEVDLEHAAECFPEDIICGNVDPALIATGRPDEVYERSRECIEKGKSFPGGFYLAPGCGVSPKAPPHNVWMMTKAVNDFGWYE